MISKQVKITYGFALLFLVGFVGHNLMYAAGIAFGENIIFTVLEVGLFLLATIVAPLGFFGSLIYNTYTYFTKKQPKDIWKLGFLGIIGILLFFMFGGFREEFFGNIFVVLFLLPLLFFIYMK